MALDHQPSQAEFQRVTAGFVALQAKLSGPDTAADAARLAEIKVRTIARNDAEIIQGWLEAGLQPLMANGRPISLPLAQLMRFPMVPLGEVAGEERVA